MELKKEIAIIGVGNCGSMISYLAHKKYPELFDTLYINTSQADLSMIDDPQAIKFKIGIAEEVEGSGKNRSKMKKYLRDDIEKILSNKDFLDTIANKKYVFIATSMAGGTGSGASPVLLDILRQAFVDTHFILVGVLPKIKDSLADQGNALEFLSELYETLGDQTTYMIYDNETVADQSPTRALEMVNENVIEDIRILTGIDNYPTQYESIDPADMESIITTPGRLLVARVNKNLTEKNMEDAAFDDLIIKSIKQSCQCETDRNKKVVRWGIITYFTDAVNKLYTSNLEKLEEFIGRPDERFNHNAVNNDGNENLNFMYLVASGLSPINDRAKKMKDRVNELRKALATDDASKYILAGDDVSREALAIRKREEKVAATPESFKPKDIFAKFMK
jgi:tubulin/ftsZ family, GTPase domain